MRLGLCLKGYKTAGSHKKKIMKATFRMSRQPRGGAETDMAACRAEAGSGSGEGDDVFKSMDAECKVCMQEIKVMHQVAYSVDDLYVEYLTSLILMVSQHAVTFVLPCALVRV